MALRIVLAVFAMTLISFATDKPASTSPAALEHSQAAALKVSKIAKVVIQPSCSDERSPGPVADKYCCCYVAQGINSVICGCAFCPLDKQPDPNKTIRPNSSWRVPELVETLR
jgi:hypothetical protein